VSETYVLLINIEHQISPTVSAVVETVELGTFSSEQEARELLEEILDAAEFEDEENPDADT